MEQAAPAAEAASAPSKLRRLLPDRAIAVLKAWLLSPEHVDHPYPTDTEKAALAAEAGITPKQVSIWFTNARKRVWIPMKQLGDASGPGQQLLAVTASVPARIRASVRPVVAASAAATPTTLLPPITESDVAKMSASELRAVQAALTARKLKLLACIRDLDAQEAALQHLAC